MELDKVLGEGGGSSDIVGALNGLVGGEGGLGGLLGQLQQGGLTEQVDSWVGKGPNQPVDPDQLESALGDDKVQALAGQTGLPIGQLMPLLAGVLPTVIDTLTPDGKVPEGDATGAVDLGGLLEGLAGAAQAGPSSPLAQLGGLLGGLGGRKG